MQVQGYQVEVLLSNYLLRLAKEYPYIKVRLEDEGVAIYYGREVLDKGANKSSIEYGDTYKEYYKRRVNIEKLEIQLQEKVTRSREKALFSKISSEELVVMSRKKVKGAFISTDMSANSKLFEYFQTHKRTVLSVQKQRYFTYLDNNVIRHNTDPIALTDFNCTIAKVILECDPTYLIGISEGCGTTIEKFVVTISQIKNLDSNCFDVYILAEGKETVTFEIINKKL